LTNLLAVVPANAAAGPNTVRVQGTISQQSNAVTVIVPTVSLSTNRSTVNNTIGYTLTNFPANSAVTITWRRLTGSTIDLGTANTDANGSAVGTFVVPATPGGPGQQITFASGAVSQTVLFEVAPRVKVTPAEVSAGDEMNVSLRGFARQESITIRWRPGTAGPWITIGSGTTSNTGSANIIIIVPQNAVAGAYQLRAETASFNAQTSALTVLAPPSLVPAEAETPTPTPEPTVEATPEPTVEITPEPTAEPTSTPEPTAEPEPTEESTPTPEVTETPAPVEEPTPTVEPAPTIEETPAP
jgi:hypothetical protein